MCRSECPRETLGCWSPQEDHSLHTIQMVLTLMTQGGSLQKEAEDIGITLQPQTPLPEGSRASASWCPLSLLPAASSLSPRVPSPHRTNVTIGLGSF